MRLGADVLLAAVLVCAVHAWSLFPRKRFKEEGFLRAGSLGLEDVRGQVAAWGYFRDDRFLDAWIVDASRQSMTVHEWNHANFSFHSTPSAHISVPSDMRIANAILADFTYDGRTDVLVMASSTSRASPPLSMFLWPMLPDGQLGEPISLPASMDAQPMSVDAAGSLRGDLLGHAHSSPDTLSVWRNVDGQMRLETPVMNGHIPPCRLAHPHSSANVDMNGDCLADLFLVCQGARAGQLTYQIWTARADTPMAYDLARTGDLPPGAGALSFADMNRDGTMDVVFPSCDRSQCYINIAYNEQMPLCSQERRGTLFSSGNPMAPERCRDALRLCEPDASFVLDMSTDVTNSRFARLPVQDLTGDTRILLTDDVGTYPQPVPVRIGDFNMDGYPDLAILTVPRGALHGQTRVHLLESVRCKKHGSVGCTASKPEHRTFRRVPNTVLDQEAYVRSVSFVDLDEDGTLDFVLQSLPPATTRTSDARVLSFVQNNYFHDAFFLKTLTLNAACGARCEREHERAYSPWGGSLLGASYKFAVLDPNGVRRAQQVAQQPQTGYSALTPPYAFFGLGRTNNYVESLFVGSTLRQADSFLVLEGVIPNSEVIVIPTDESPDAWRRELFLHPADWIPFVTMALAGLIALLSLVVFMLDLNEKHEDERERRRAVHAINFDAL